MLCRNLAGELCLRKGQPELIHGADLEGVWHCDLEEVAVAALAAPLDEHALERAVERPHRGDAHLPRKVARLERTGGRYVRRDLAGASAAGVPGRLE